MSDSEEDLDESIDYESFRAGELGKLRKDGRPLNEGNIKYKYKLLRGLKLSASKAKKPRHAIAHESSTRFDTPTSSRAPQAEADEDEEEAGGEKENEKEGPHAYSTPATTPGWRDPEIERLLSFEESGNNHSANMNAGQAREKRDVSGSNQPVASSSAIGGNNNPINYINANRSGEAHFSFEHTHLLNTWGNAYCIKTPGKDYETKTMLTSLACIPVNSVSFWMTYSEYKNLPMGTRIDSVECIVIPKGFKTSFDTGTSITSSANNTQGVFAQVAVGLNIHLLVRNYEVTRNPTQPMIIDNFNIPSTHDISERLWGHEKFDDNFDKSIPSCMGVSRSLPFYAGIMMPYKSTEHKGKPITTGWPDLMKFVKTFNFLDHIEKPCVHYVYKVKTNCINPKRTQTINDDAAHHDCVMGGEDISLYVGKLAVGKGFSIKRCSELKSVAPHDMGFDKYIADNVEYSGSVTIPDHTPPNSGHAQPQLHIGILPVQSNSPAKEIQEYVTSCATWEVRTRVNLVTDYHQHYVYDNINAPHRVPFGARNTGVKSMYNNSVFGFSPMNT